jgi:hypothetical protein
MNSIRQIGRMTRLSHPNETVELQAQVLTRECTLFRANPSLIDVPYSLKSVVSVADFREFIATLSGRPISITNDNFTGLSLLCKEFGFDSLSSRLSEFRSSPDLSDTFSIEDIDARVRLSALEEYIDDRDRAIADLQFRISQQSQTFVSVMNRLTELEKAVAALRDASTVSKELEVGLFALKSWAGAMNSAIVSGFPDVFAGFRGKQFSLLWRGSSDGFASAEFHKRCDGRANTLTIIEDTDGNVFGGFTPLKWNNKSGYTADPNLKSFLFTLRNPHKLAPRTFALKRGYENWAIWCGPIWGPHLNDIYVCDGCQSRNESGTAHFGSAYNNDTGLDGKTLLTGAPTFRVKEIEVFAIGQ